MRENRIYPFRRRSRLPRRFFQTLLQCARCESIPACGDYAPDIHPFEPFEPPPDSVDPVIGLVVEQMRLLGLHESAVISEKIDRSPPLIIRCFFTDSFPGGLDGVFHLVTVVEYFPDGWQFAPDRLERSGHKLQDALSSVAHRFYTGNAQDAGQLADIELAARFLELVEHVEGEHHRFASFNNLREKIEATFEPGGVGDDDDGGNFLRHDAAPGDALVEGQGADAVGAREIDEGYGGVIHRYGAFLDFDGDAWIVADVLS